MCYGRVIKSGCERKDLTVERACLEMFGGVFCGGVVSVHKKAHFVGKVLRAMFNESSVTICLNFPTC